MMRLQENLGESNDSQRKQAKVKIYRLVQLLRLVAASYLVWVLFQVLRPWYGFEAFVNGLGRYWARDLTAAQPWQVSASVLLNLGLWSLLLVAVVFYWRAMGLLLKDMAFTSRVGSLLLRGAWFGMACEVLTLASRPLWSYLWTLHLPATQALFRWDFYANDLLATMLCFVLLIFAYLFTWMVEIAEENRGFV